jgi:hypothetical protein
VLDAVQLAPPPTLAVSFLLQHVRKEATHYAGSNKRSIATFITSCLLLPLHHAFFTWGLSECLNSPPSASSLPPSNTTTIAVTNLTVLANGTMLVATGSIISPANATSSDYYQWYNYARGIQYNVVMSIILFFLANMIQAMVAQKLAGNFYRWGPDCGCQVA